MSGPFQGVYDDPYDPNSPSYRPDTPPLDILIKEAIDAQMLNLHTWLPAVVTQVLGNQRVNVQPLLQSRYVTPDQAGTGQGTGGRLVKIQAIQNCMVCMPMGANYSIKLPVKVGDIGIALFCERSLDNFTHVPASAHGNDLFVDPADVRHHDLSDAIFIPGAYPFSKQTQDATDDLVLKNVNAIVSLGTELITLKNEVTSLKTVLLDLIAGVNAMTVTVTVTGVQPGGGSAGGTGTVSGVPGSVNTEIDNLLGD